MSDYYRLVMSVRCSNGEKLASTQLLTSEFLYESGIPFSYLFKKHADVLALDAQQRGWELTSELKVEVKAEFFPHFYDTDYE